MTQVSRRPLSKSFETEMFQLFRTVVSDLHADGDVQNFLDDLLSPTEKIMLGKRLAIAFLLDQGYDQRTIHTMMKVSITTVTHVNYWFTHKGDGYRAVIKRVRTNQKWQRFFQTLDARLRNTLSEKAIRSRIHTLPFDKPIEVDTF